MGIDRNRIKTHLHAAILLPAKLHLSKLSFTNGISQDEVAKLGSRLVVATVVMAASSAASLLGARVHGYGRRRGGIDVVRGVLVGSSAGRFFAVGNDPVQVFACLARRLGVCCCLMSTDGDGDGGRGFDGMATSNAGHRLGCGQILRRVVALRSLAPGVVGGAICVTARGDPRAVGLHTARRIVHLVAASLAGVGIVG